MKKNSKGIIILVAMAIVVLPIFHFTIGQRVIEIQLHDTYFIFTITHILILLIGPLLLLVFLPLALRRKFKTTWTNIGLLMGLILVSLIIFQVAIFQINYREQIEKNGELIALPLNTGDKEQFMGDLNRKINLTYGLLGICLAGVGLMCFRTYKLIMEEK